ncbi:MAG: Asp-tRNA(Asn)/Glu-tRNA(Gln) amidotransferase subunit GatC [Tissierellia bacterium]|nr:Asp-tRNA(Asn)/Glu-tRNA(Gln) amidotransferase subunit GatC [Tissierellia bacterium]
MDIKDVVRIYKLAKLELKEDEVSMIADKFNQTLDFIKPIFEVDTKDVELEELAVSHLASLREDKVLKSIDRSEALKNAKDTEYGYFRLNWEL